MVQIIEENRKPSSSERFSQAIGGGINAFSQLRNMQQEKQQQEKQKMQQMQQMEQENEAAKRMGIDLSGIQNPEMRKMALQYALMGQNKESEQNRQFGFQREENELQRQSKADQLAGKGKEGEEVKNTAQNAFNSAASLLKKGNLGLGSGVKSKLFGGETARDVGQFQSALGGIEAMLVDMVSRGSLSDARFKYITETLLPKTSDRDETIKGKLTGLAQILGLDPSELNGEKKGEKKSLEDIFG